MSLSIGPTSLDLPAWVQAIGSVGAIALTAWIAHRDGVRRDADRATEIAAEARTLFQRHARFARHIGQQVQNARGLLAEQIREVDAILRAEGVDDDRLVEEIPVNLHAVVRDLILRPLERIQALPLDYWPDPDFAAYFHDGLAVLALRYKDYDRVAKEQLLPSTGARLRQLRAASAELHLMASAFNAFDSFNRLVREYRQESEDKDVDDLYPFHKRAVAKWEAEENAKLLAEEEERKREWAELKASGVLEQN